MFHDCVVRRDDDFAVGVVLVHRERRNQVDLVAWREAGDFLAHRIDDAGCFVAETCWELDGLDVFVGAPHGLCAVDAYGLDVDADFGRAGSGYVCLDEFEDFRTAGCCEFDGAGHK